jgi:hypothetical protein
MQAGHEPVFAVECEAHAVAVRSCPLRDDLLSIHQPCIPYYLHAGHKEAFSRPARVL